MMKHKTSLLVSTLLLTQFSAANAAQPDAETLVGNVYGGLHGAYLEADSDRLNTSSFNRAGGYGAELGYRLSAPVELRLSYSRFEAELKRGSNIQGINKYGLDALFFPTEKNLYLLGGLNALDFNTDTEAALNVGLGYRQYFTDQFAGYVEGKGSYQFDGNYADAIAQVGIVYFFDTNEKVVPVKPQPVAYVAPVAIDTDKDGVVDGKDQCASTPMNDKVDEVGCTIFEKERLSYRLLVNFDNNKAVVKSEYYSELAKVSAFLKQYPHVNITVDGYTSAVGKASYNQKLSQKRADAITGLLTSEYGIDASRLTAIGHGETNLLDSSNTAEASKMNRRIEINIEETRKVAVER
ncbi:OmpA family protein [Psychromonas arctica]|uniref:OmpA family protein n=1 Tax=Psychromonas arctica TaxID=168275 RepID=A0ABU9H886_9GAMM